MSATLTSRSTPRDGNRISLSEAGPYVCALLARERTVLLEWEHSPGQGLRREGRLAAGARPGELLDIQLAGSAGGDRPQPGVAVMLIMPVHNTLWRFHTKASAAVGGHVTSVPLEWPSDVVQETARRFARAPITLPVTVSLRDDGQPLTICTHTLDVSIGGVQLALPRKLPSGHALRLSIRLPQETVAADGAVAWTRTLRDEPGDPMYSLGVQFAQLAPRVATRLRTLLVASGLAAG